MEEESSGSLLSVSGPQLPAVKTKEDFEKGIFHRNFDVDEIWLFLVRVSPKLRQLGGPGMAVPGPQSHAVT